MSLPQFRDSIYLGRFRNVINQGAAGYYDLSIGTTFIQQWNDWKAGSIKSHNLYVAQITEDIRRIFQLKSLEINAAASLQTLQITVNGKPYKLRELGAGLAQFIITFANVAIRRPQFILIDEPELNLHPSLQIDFLTSLASYASRGVIFATHSIGLARSTAERLYSFSRNDAGIRVKPFEQTPQYAEFLGEMSFSAYQDLGHESVLLVEGVTDVKTVQQFLRRYGKEHSVVVVPLGGSQFIRGGLDLELAELKRLTKRIAVIVDSERTAAASPPDKAHLEFQATCKTLGFDVLLTKLRATENYFTDRAVKAALGPRFSAIGPYELLRESVQPWAKSDNWRIAREMTRAEIDASDLGPFLQFV